MKRGLLTLLLAAAAVARAAPEPAQPPQLLPLGRVSAYPGALALSGDGRVAAHVSAAGGVQLWDAATALLRPDTPAIRPAATSVALNADGSQLVTGHADGRLLLWTRGGTAPLREFRGHGGRVLAVDLSPDGTRLASGSADGTAQVFDVATGQRLQVLDAVYNGHPVEGVAATTDVAFAAGGRRLVTQDWQRRQYDVGRVVTLWEPASGVEVAALPADPPGGDEALQAGAALGGRGWWLARSGPRQLTVQRLDGCGPARALGRSGDEGPASGRHADTLAADPLGRWVATAHGGELRFFATGGGAAGTPIALPGPALSLKPLADGRQLLAVLAPAPDSSGPRMTGLSTDAPPPAPAQIWRIAVPARLLTAAAWQPAADAQPCPPPDAVRQRQASTGTETPAALTVTARLSPAVPALPTDGQLPLGPLQQLRFDAQGQLLGLYLQRGDTRAGVAAWALDSGQTATGRPLPPPPDIAAPLWLGMDWAVANSSGAWSRATTGQPLLGPAPLASGPVVAADAISGQLLRAQGRTIERVSADGTRLPALTARAPVTALAARAGRVLALTANGEAELFSRTPAAARAMPGLGQPAEAGSPPDLVTRLMLSADGRFAHASVDPGTQETPGQDIAWTLGGGTVGTGFALTELASRAPRIVTADTRAHRLAVWDIDRGEAIARLPRQRSRDAAGNPALLQAALSDDGQRVASGSPDGLVRVWDLATRRLLGEARVGAAVTALAFDPSAQRLAVGRAGGQAWVLALP